MSRQLVVIAGLERGRTLALQDGDILQLGCSQTLDVTTRFRDPEIARVHCEVQVQGDRVFLVDSGTKFGTYVNGRRISREELHAGDVIRIGRTELRYLTEDPGSSSFDSLDDTLIVKRRTDPNLRAVEQAPDPLSGLVGQEFTHYHVDLVLGTGQWGRVFQAHDTRDRRLVALKVMRPEFAASKEVVHLFAAAMRMTMPVLHNNLLMTYGAGKSGPFCWIASEHIDGKSLTQLIRRIQTTGAIDLPLAFRVGLHLSRVLVKLHDHNLIHGNLTPQNVLVRDRDRTVKLSDLLLSIVQQDMRPELRAPLGESLTGMPFWPPERFQADGKVTASTDSYGLGAMLYALLTGRPPFEGKTRDDLQEQIENDAVIEPTRCQEEVPAELERIVLRLLEKDPEDRYQSAAEILANLEAAAQASQMTQ